MKDGRAFKGKKMTEKPKSIEEVKTLISNGDIEIMLAEDLPDGTTRLLVCDYRRTFDENEVYEIIV